MTLHFPLQPGSLRLTSTLTRSESLWSRMQWRVHNSAPLPTTRTPPPSDPDLHSHPIPHRPAHSHRRESSVHRHVYPADDAARLPHKMSPCSPCAASPVYEHTGTFTPAGPGRGQAQRAIDWFKCLSWRVLEAELEGKAGAGGGARTACTTCRPRDQQRWGGSCTTRRSAA